jgi:hypothetical protein
MGPEKAIMQDRLDQARRLSRKHMQLQARQLAATLEEELMCRAEASQMDMEVSAQLRRVQKREDELQKEREARLKARREHQANTFERARYLEWSTAMEQLRQQESLEERRIAAGEIRTAEKNQALAERRRQQEAIEERQREHEAMLERERQRKEAEYEYKIGRINLMEERQKEILEDIAQSRRDAYGRYEALKTLYYESAVANNDDLLRRILENIVPRLSSIPHTPRSSITNPTFYTRSRAASAGPVSTPRPTLHRSPRRSRPSTPKRPNSARARASSAHSPTSARSLLGALSTSTSQRCVASSLRTPANSFASKVSLDSRSTSAASLAGSSFKTPSHSGSCESMHTVSPVGSVASRTKIPLVLAENRNQPSGGAAAAMAPAAEEFPCTPPRHVQRNVNACSSDLATFARIKRDESLSFFEYAGPQELCIGAPA